LKQRNEYVKSLDSDHITNYAEYDVAGMTPFNKVQRADTVGVELYPVSYTSIDDVYPEMLRAVKEAAPLGQAVFGVLQTFAWHQPGKPVDRIPTFTEYRSMLNQAIRAGVKGVVNYTFLDDDNYLPDYRELWAGLQKLPAEILKPAPVDPPLPSPEPPLGLAVDIGNPAIKGSLTVRATADGVVCTITAGGKDIWDRQDQFFYLCKEVTNGVTITARVQSVGPTNPWSKGGVMLRSTLDPGSPHVFFCRTPGNGAAVQYRARAGGKSSHLPVSGAPTWLRLVRSGRNVVAMVSVDGIIWTWANAVAVPLGSPLYAGLAVTSHDAGKAVEAVFDQVALS
jgi:hypothetical protein